MLITFGPPARRVAVLLLAGLLVEGCSRSRDEQRDISALVGELEQVVKLPKDALPLASYTRYYALMDDGTLKGVYLAEGDDSIHIVPGQRLPMVFDGGCYVVTVRYDTESKTVQSAMCNGIA